jgi:hypothetical protein
VASEHARLSAENAENYDLAVAKKIGEMSPVRAALIEWEDAQNVGIATNTSDGTNILTSTLTVPNGTQQHAL